MKESSITQDSMKEDSVAQDSTPHTSTIHALPHNWLICGIVPDSTFPLCLDTWHLERDEFQSLTLQSAQGRTLPIQRGTTSLIASTLVALQTGNTEANTPSLPCLLVGDTGSGAGSRELYAQLADNILKERTWDGITFHYLFPDVDGHNRVLMACETLTPKPFLIADAGFMYVAKMSGYADFYDVFTPDIGEMAFLADEHAPHPFYTRGFLLADETEIPALIERARLHKNIAAHLIIKGKTDYIVDKGRIISCVTEPNVPSMEAIGGTGDLVTGFATAAIIMQKARIHDIPNIPKALHEAAQSARHVALKAHPTPATHVEAILRTALVAQPQS